MKNTLLSLLLLASQTVCAQQKPEDKLQMAFYALQNRYVDQVAISPLVEQQMTILMSSLDPHTEYMPASKANATAGALLTGCCIRHTDQNASLLTAYTSQLSPATSSAPELRSGIGIIPIEMFHQTTADIFHATADSLLRAGAKGIVIDLRGNGGGFFETALALADECVPVGTTLITTRGQHSEEATVKAQVKGLLERTPVAILVDENTRSASEIFAAIMQDLDRAVIVGRRTFGKGVVQETLPFADGSAICLTVARCFTPSGRCIQRPYARMSTQQYWNEPSTRPADGSLRPEEMNDQHKSTRLGRTLYGKSAVQPDLFVPADADPIAIAIDVLNGKHKNLKPLLK